MQFGEFAPLPIHWVPLTICVNGVLYAECRAHKVRIFIRDRAIVEEIVKKASVVGETATAKRGDP